MVKVRKKSRGRPRGEEVSSSPEGQEQDARRRELRGRTAHKGAAKKRGTTARAKPPGRRNPTGRGGETHTHTRAAAKHTLVEGSTGHDEGRRPEQWRRWRASGAGRRRGCREGGPGREGQLVSGRQTLEAGFCETRGAMGWGGPAQGWASPWAPGGQRAHRGCTRTPKHGQPSTSHRTHHQDVLSATEPAQGVRQPQATQLNASTGKLACVAQEATEGHDAGLSTTQQAQQPTYHPRQLGHSRQNFHRLATGQSN